MAEALVITDTAYAGEAASVMITRAVIEMDTVNKGCIYVKDGIKKEFRMPRLEVTGFMQHRQATPTSQGTITIDGQLLYPKDYMLYLEFNPRDFETHWYAYQLKPELIDRTLPQTAEAFLIYQLSKRVNEFNEKAIWRSRTAFDPANGGTNPVSKGQAASDSQYQYFDGLVYKMLSDAGTIQIGSPTTLTSANILAAMNSVLFGLPEALVDKKGSDGVKFLFNKTTKRIYDDALTNLTYKDNFFTESSKEMYKGYEIKTVAGLTDNTIVACLALPDVDSALWLGLNSTADEQTVLLKQFQNNSELYFLKMLFKADVQFAWSDQIVLYTTVTL